MRDPREARGLWSVSYYPCQWSAAAAVASGVLLLLTCFLLKAAKLSCAQGVASHRWLAFFAEDAIGGSCWLALVWTLAMLSARVRHFWDHAHSEYGPTCRRPHRALVWIAIAAVNGFFVILALINFAFVSTTIGDCVYFCQMGDSLDLRTIQLALGPHAKAMQRAARTQFPWALPLLVATVAAYAIALVCCVLAWRRLGVLASGRSFILNRQRAPVRGATTLVRLLVTTVLLCVATVVFNASNAGMAVRNEFIIGRGGDSGPSAIDDVPFESSVISRLRRNPIVTLSREARQQWWNRMSAPTSGSATLPFTSKSTPFEHSFGGERATSGRAAEAIHVQGNSRPPDVILLLLEGVRYDSLPTDTREGKTLRSSGMRTNSAASGVLEHLRSTKLLVHAPHTYTSVPNTIKATYAALCGVIPEPPLSESYLREYEESSALLEGCLPRVLGRSLNSTLGRAYETTFLTSSVALDAVQGRLGFQNIHGFNAGGQSWSQQIDSIGKQASFSHGRFERVNWLGYDDEVLLQPALAAVRKARSQGQSAFVALFTVGTHARYARVTCMRARLFNLSFSLSHIVTRTCVLASCRGDDPYRLVPVRCRYTLPSHLHCQDDGTIISAKDEHCCWSFNKETKRHRHYLRPANTSCIASYRPNACPAARGESAGGGRWTEQAQMEWRRVQREANKKNLSTAKVCTDLGAAMLPSRILASPRLHRWSI